MFCSFIIPTRNDNYGNFSMQDFRFNLESLIKKLSGSSREFEIIVVQWNRVEGNPCLSDIIDPINFDKNITIRFVSVPNVYHSKLMYSKLKSFCSEAAINVGIRRATGTFCCIKMQDTVYSKGLVHWLREGHLDEDKIYRAIRIDHNLEGVEGLSEADLNRGDVYRYSPSGRYFTNACGDFMLMPTNVLFEMGGWVDPGRVVSTGSDGITLARAICHGLSQVILPDECVVLKKWHSNMFRLRTSQIPSSVFRVSVYRIFESLGRLSAFKLLYKTAGFFKLLINGITGFPRARERGVPVDNWGRYFLKFHFNLYFGKVFNASPPEWGLPTAQITEKKIISSYATCWNKNI